MKYIISWTPADSHWVWGTFFLCNLACWRETTAKQSMSLPVALEFSKAASPPYGTCLTLLSLRSYKITVAGGMIVLWDATSTLGRALSPPVLAPYSWLRWFSAPFSDVKGRNGSALNKSQGLWNRKRNISEKRESIWEELSAWETSSWVTESWHSFYLFIKFVTVEISLRSCRPITVSFIILLRHTLRHSWRLNPIVLCNKPIIDYAMEL